jgi:molecular chaperone DnaJ
MRAEGVTFKTCTTVKARTSQEGCKHMLGQMVSASTCPTCDGSGQVIEKKPNGWTIPACFTEEFYR